MNNDSTKDEPRCPVCGIFFALSPNHAERKAAEQGRFVVAAEQGRFVVCADCTDYPAGSTVRFENADGDILTGEIVGHPDPTADYDVYLIAANGMWSIPEDGIVGMAEDDENASEYTSKGCDVCETADIPSKRVHISNRDVPDEVVYVCEECEGDA